jgi:hypothetical protein
MLSDPHNTFLRSLSHPTNYALCPKQYIDTLSASYDTSLFTLPQRINLYYLCLTKYIPMIFLPQNTTLRFLSHKMYLYAVCPKLYILMLSVPQSITLCSLFHKIQLYALRTTQYTVMIFMNFVLNVITSTLDSPLPGRHIPSQAHNVLTSSL